MKAKPRTTITEVLRTIARIKYVGGYKVKWVLKKDKVTNHSGLIRVRVGTRRLFCPVTFYCLVKENKKFWPDQTEQAAKCSGLTGVIQSDLDDAADNVGNEVLRKKLLRITGLLESARKKGEKI